MTLSLRHRQPQIVPSPVSPDADTEYGAAPPSKLAFDKIDEMIGQLAAAGALDEGNKRALDGLIASWQAQHREALTAFHLDLAGNREERIQTLRLTIELARQRLDSAQKMLDRLEPSGAAGPDDDRPTTLEDAA